MKYFFFHALCLCSVFCNAQPVRYQPAPLATTSTVTYSLSPDWMDINPEVFRKSAVMQDSVFLFANESKNSDSSLVLAQYFDSSGLMQETDEYAINKKGVLRRVTNYSYVDDLLYRKEEISRSDFSINHVVTISKDITTYDYDSAGHVTREKKYSYFGDSLKQFTLSVKEREYDSEGHLVKEYLTNPGSRPFLRSTYSYEHSKLSEARFYDSNQIWLYSYIHQYNGKFTTERIYLTNADQDKQLQKEFFYDDLHRLIKAEVFSEGILKMDHTTQTYRYDASGLMERQDFKDITGKNYYYKHHYLLRAN